MVFETLIISSIFLFLPVVCEPLTKWKEKCCYSCFCKVEGTVGCTKKTCPPILESRRRSSAIRQGNDTEKKSWHENCFCSNGKPVFLREFCPTVNISNRILPLCSNEDNDDYLKTKTEIEEAIWKENCHRCICVHFRKNCTRELCPNEFNLRKTAAKGNERTKRSDKSFTSSEEETKCPLNVEQWEEDCNQCYCDNGEKVCTKALCTDQGPSVAIVPKQ